jgi:hypothetical protein
MMNKWSEDCLEGVICVETREEPRESSYIYNDRFHHPILYASHVISYSTRLEISVLGGVKISSYSESAVKPVCGDRLVMKQGVGITVSSSRHSYTIRRWHRCRWV